MSDGGASPDRPLMEIVPNFSEGRRQDVIDAIVSALQVPGVTLVNVQWDPDHNRLDSSLIGSPEAVKRSALAGSGEGRGAHRHGPAHRRAPRMGAVDVIPFLPIRGVTMDDCIALAREVGQEIGETLGVPVYLYDRAALTPDRRQPRRRSQGRVRGPEGRRRARASACRTSGRTRSGAPAPWPWAPASRSSRSTST